MTMEYHPCDGKKVQKVKTNPLQFRKFCTIIYKAMYCLLVCRRVDGAKAGGRPSALSPFPPYTNELCIRTENLNRSEENK